ncbi:MAG: hypothetical protein INR73_16070 [Williamsia sp.]|nr:hypothetical protein [Williamsia sp.]
MRLIAPLLAILLLLVSCSSRKLAKVEEAKGGELIFQSGFENSSRIVGMDDRSDIAGMDKSLPNRNDWVADLDNHPNIGNFSIQYEGGDSTMRYARIIAEPGNPDNHVLQFWLKEPNVHGTKGRIQANIYGNNGLKEFYQQERIFLHPDFNAVRSFPQKIHWLTLAEFWNNITWSQTVPYRFRITLGIGKLIEGEDDLHFILDAEDCQLFPDNRQKYTTVWAEVNKEVKIPIGKWFTLEYYFKEGDNKTGRFYMAITPAGEKKQVIFDVRKITHNTEDPHPDGVGEFNPLKLYTSKELINYMNAQHKALQIYWDDFKLWKDKRPE